MPSVGSIELGALSSSCGPVRAHAVALWALLLGAHLVALYWPRVELAGMPPDSDKLGHALLFGLPVLAALLTMPRRWAGVAVGALAAHAPVSEWVQAAVLPSRSGDPRDVVTDLVGVLVGALIGWAWARRLEKGPSRRW